MLGSFIRPNNANAFNQLTADPSAFLRRFPLRVFGSETESLTLNAQIGPRQQSNPLRTATLLGNSMMVSTHSFDIRTPRSVGINSQGAPHTFNAHFVHMTDSPPAEVQLYPLPAGSPSIMITPLLSGCCIVIQPGDSGLIEVAHVRPSKGMPGAQLREALVAQFPNAVVYGPGADYDSSTQRVTIVGVFKNQREWRLYAQVQVDDTYNYQVQGAQRIYPPAA